MAFLTLAVLGRGGDDGGMGAGPGLAMVQSLLFERPWVVIIVLVGVAVVLRLLSQRTGRRGLHVASILVLAGAVGVWGLSRAVTTEREQLREHTQALVAATEEPIDWQQVDALIGPDTQLYDNRGELWMAAGQIRERLEQTVGRAGVREQTVRGITVELLEEGRGSTELDLRTETERGGGLSIPTRWRLVWEQGETGWQVAEVHFLELRGREAREGVRELGAW